MVDKVGDWYTVAFPNPELIADLKGGWISASDVVPERKPVSVSTPPSTSNGAEIYNRILESIKAIRDSSGATRTFPLADSALTLAFRLPWTFPSSSRRECRLRNLLKSISVESGVQRANQKSPVSVLVAAKKLCVTRQSPNQMMTSSQSMRRDT